MRQRLADRLNGLSVWRLVIIFAALTLIPLLLLAYFSLHFARNALKEKAIRRTDTAAAVGALYLEERLSSLADLSDSYAKRPLLVRVLEGRAEPRDRGVVQRSLEELVRRPDVETAFIASPRGRLVAISPATPSIIGDDFSYRDWYRGVIKTGRPYVSEVYRSKATGRPLVSGAAAPIYGRHGKLLGITVVAAGLDSIEMFGDGIAGVQGVHFTIADQAGHVVSGGTGSVAGNERLQAALRGEAGTAEVRDEGEPFLVAYAPLPKIGWAIEAAIHTDVALAGIRPLTSTVLGITVLLLLVLLAGLSLLAFVLRERRRAQEMLVAASEAAETANRAKSEFLSRMSHELRTPLNAILGFAQLLEMDELAPQQKDSVHEIVKGGNHLLELINEVLDIARIEAGRLSLSMEPVPVPEVIDETLRLVRPLAQQRGIEIIPPSCDLGLRAVADRQRLKQILLNLLSNAVKYNRPEGTVTVNCVAAGELLTVAVRDTGEGIPEDKLDCLFLPFDRLGAETTGVEGTGLGLALAKTLAEAMDGSLTARNVEGGGSEFTLRLRFQPETEHLEDAWVPPPPDHGGDRTILYIEDNLPNLRLIERLLERRPGMTLLSAMQGSMGIDLAREHLPDLILLDVHLPDMDGRQVLLDLKRDPRTTAIPTILITADATPGQRRRLRDAGADAFLPKPINARDFFALLDRMLKGEEVMTGAT